MFLTYFPIYGCAKFSALRAIVSHVPSCHHAFVGSLWVQNLSCAYFADPQFFLVDILWVLIFLWVFCGSQIFSRGYFVDPQFLLLGISWVPSFFSWVFCSFKIFSRGQFCNFLVFAAWEIVVQKYIWDFVPNLQFHCIF